MADTKITALTAITTVDPANDVLPIVDVSDTSMAASGTTKKITTNQILGASGTATLASATITGDLTVDTSTLKVDSATNNVSIGGLVNKVTGVSGSGTGLTIQASAGPTLGLWDTTDPSYFTNLAQVDANCYLYNNAAGALLFGVGNVEAMRLNSTGLGVGRSPSYKLDVAGIGNFDQLRIAAAAATKIDLVNNTTAVTYSLFNANSASNGFDGFGIFNGTSYDLRIVSGNVGIGVTPSAKLDVAVTGAGTPRVRFTSDSDNPIVEWQRFQGTATNYYGYRIQGGFGALAFLNSNVAAIGSQTWTQAMTLDASGNLLVGKTAASVTTVGFQTLANGEASVAMAASTGASTTLNVWSTGAAAYRFYVGMNGTISATNTTISAISDARLKENVQDIDVGLGAILALKPRKFDWKSGKGKDIKGDRGFIAQEFEQVFPNLIDEWKDPAPEGEAPYKSVRQDLIPVLVKAIQELAARVQTLETR